MSVVTRFAPSPTGYLHIGGARTALFNWLFARRMGGKYLLRIEDTDRARSTQAAIDAILEGLDWLGLGADDAPVFQSERAPRHREVAEAMIAKGTAFRCYITPAEMEGRRERADKARAELKALQIEKGALVWGDKEKGKFGERKWGGGDFGDPVIASKIAEVEELTAAFRSPYRNGSAAPSPDAPFVVRLRAPDEGEVLNADLVQGEVRIKAADIDDLVLLRADGDPTYMLSVVVDDHDMGITHVIRGDDHLTNAARQIPIFQAMGWTPPTYAHIPLIHGPDGAKLSKRHGALAVQAYREMGYLPEALNNYLMRLGWSHGDQEIMTRDEAAAVFDVAKIGKAPSRLDFAKLDSVNAHYMREADDARLASLLFEHLATKPEVSVTAAGRERVLRAMGVLKTRAKTIVELAEQARFLLAERPIALDAAAQKVKDDSREILLRVRDRLGEQSDWTAVTLGAALKAFAAEAGVGMGKIGPGLRAALTGGAPAPDLGQSLEFLGRDETLARLTDQL